MKRALQLIAISATPLFLTAAGALAQDRVISPDEQARWNAIGRVTLGRITADRGCTGTLIAPDLVVTAAHCAVGFDEASPSKLATLSFTAGWNNGAFAGTSTAARVVYPPEHQPGELNLRTIPHDIALIELVHPIEDVPPLPLLAEVPPDQTVSLVAYANGRMNTAAISEGCVPISPIEGLLFLTCAVISGNSGAPVLVDGPEGLAVVAVVSSRGAGGAYAARVGDWLQDQLR